jgi:hypothetical protein
MKKALFIVWTIIVFVSSFAFGQQTVKEPSTEKLFPAQVTIKNADKQYTLTVTGLAVRKKMFFKVYGIAHYMEQVEKANSNDDAYNTVLIDGKAKQITMDFARDVDVAKIKDAYIDGFKTHTSGDDLKKIRLLVDQFIGYFSKDLKENDQIILRWLPGGSVTAIIKGEEKPAIKDMTFARALWTIWFGKDSIVDREDLVKIIVR